MIRHDNKNIADSMNHETNTLWCLMHSTLVFSKHLFLKYNMIVSGWISHYHDDDKKFPLGTCHATDEFSFCWAISSICMNNFDVNTRTWYKAYRKYNLYVHRIFSKRLDWEKNLEFIQERVIGLNLNQLERESYFLYFYYSHMVKDFLFYELGNT